MIQEGKLTRVYTNRDVYSYDLINLPTELRTKVLDAFNNPDYAVNGKKLMSGVIYFLHYLCSKDVELGIVTARPKTLEEDTIEFIKNNMSGINFTLGIHFCNTYSSTDLSSVPPKKEILKKYNPDMYFDDHLQYCEEASSLGIKTGLISNDHTPWNQRVEIGNNIRRFKNVCFLPYKELGEKQWASI